MFGNNQEKENDKKIEIELKNINEEHEEKESFKNSNNNNEKKSKKLFYSKNSDLSDNMNSEKKLEKIESIREESSILNMESDLSDDLNSENERIQEESNPNKELGLNILDIDKIKEEKKKIEKMEKEEDEFKSVDKQIKFTKIIKKNGRDFYKDASFFSFYLFCFRNRANNQKYLSLNNALNLINKKLELIRYFKNLQLLRIIGKITLFNYERYFFKNHYKDLVDSNPVVTSIQKEERHKIKTYKMIDFINVKSNELFSDMDKPGEIMFNNIFNQNDPKIYGKK
jgi:hypothetical protein